MKKRNKKLSRLFALCLLCAIGGLIAVSGTYAKYTTALAGEDTATVAKWAWKIGETDLKNFKDTGLTGATTDFTLNLFDTINEEDTETEEENVKSSKIAPGTGGTIALTITNNSDVDGELTLTLEETENSNDVPIEYSIDKTTWKKAVDFSLGDDPVAVDMGNSETINLYWRWAFEQDPANPTTGDTKDTEIGFAAAEAVKDNEENPLKVVVTSTLKLTQVD